MPDQSGALNEKTKTRAWNVLAHAHTSPTGLRPHTRTLLSGSSSSVGLVLSVAAGGARWSRIIRDAFTRQVKSAVGQRRLNVAAVCSPAKEVWGEGEQLRGPAASQMIHAAEAALPGQGVRTYRRPEGYRDWKRKDLLKPPAPVLVQCVKFESCSLRIISSHVFHLGRKMKGPH